MTAGTTRDPAAVGPYRLVRKLGEGGMGVVHLATDPAGRAVALKVLRAHVANDDEARRRLGREVATLRRVRHPQVAEVLDADVAGAEPYLVTRFVPGRSLEEEVRSTGPLPAGQVARVGRTLAGALSAIHAAGVVHRDLKPANVMLVDGEPVLIDFGIAHVADESRITRTGLVMGTPGYLSPELIYGGAVTPATDWWAWGATLAFASTGRQPFGSGPIEVILERVRRGQGDLDGVEPGLRELLAETLTVDAEARPSFRELMFRLDEVIAGVTTAPSAVDDHGRPTALPNDPTTRTAPPSRSRQPARTRPASAQPAPSRPAPSHAAANGGAPIPPYPGVRSAAHGAPPYRSQAPQASQPPYPQNYPGYPAAQPQYQQPQYHSPSGYGAAQGYPQGYPGSQASYPRPQYHPPTGNPYAPSAARPYGQQAYPWAPGPGGGQGPTPQQPWYPSAGEPRQQTFADSADQVASARVTGTLAALMIALAAVGSVAPGAAIVLALLLSVLARLVQRSTAGLQRRREELGGPRSTDVVVTVAALPWRLFMSLVMSVVTAVLPLLVATSTAFIVGAAAAQDGAPRPTGPLALFVGMLAGAATAWWGPGGWSLRTGTRAIVRTVARGRGLRMAFVALCALVLVAAWMVAHQTGYAPDWTPFPAPSTWR